MDTPKLGDLRDWLDVVDDLGQLTVVDGAHWDLEIGAISEINYRRPQAVRGAAVRRYSRAIHRGYRVLTGRSATRGAWRDARPRSRPRHRRLVHALRGKPLRVGGGRRPASSRGSSSRARFSRTSSRAATFDLTRFPAPLWHEHDGGRYIGTGVAVVTSDPDTGRINVRRLPHDDPGERPPSAVINAEAGKQGRAQYDRWFAKHGKAPVLASFGHDPLLLMVAGTEVPNTISEYAYAGAMIGQKLGGRARPGHRPADAGVGGDRRRRLDPPRPHAPGRPVRRVDRLLLGLAASRPDHRHRAALLPQRSDHPRRAARQAAATTTPTCARC